MALREFPDGLGERRSFRSGELVHGNEDTAILP